MSEYRMRRRTRLKHRDAHALRDEVSKRLGGASLWADDAAVETGDLPGLTAVLVDGQIHAIVEADEPFLSVRGLLAYRPADRFVTVDMGAVRFVHNGADIMAPGIVDADPALREGDWCWVRDERNKQPLAVGRCLMDGPAMVEASAGKAVRSVHYLGDKVWDVDV